MGFAVVSLTAPPRPVLAQEPKSLRLLFPGHHTLEELLSSKLPGPAMKSIEAIAEQIESEILEQLLSVPTLEELRKVFSSLFPRFSFLQYSIGYIMWSHINDVSELSQISILGSSELKEEIEKLGPEALGEEASNNLISGIAAASILYRAAQKRPEIEIDDSTLAELQGWFIAYVLAFLAVLHYLRKQKGRRQNAMVLAKWSLYYAAGAYRVAKDSGLLQVPSVTGDAPEPDEEDLMFSEASVNDMARYLAEEGE